MHIKNELGFKDEQLHLLLTYCKMIRKYPSISLNQFHKIYSEYSRRKTTTKLIKDGYQKKVILGPFLFANIGIEVRLFENINNPIKYLEECRQNKKTTLAYALEGGWSFIHFQYGASMIKFADSIIPHNYSVSNKYIENLTFEKKGKLSLDPYPHGWSEEHWKIFHLMREPQKVTFKEIVKETGMAWETFRKYYKEILNQCKPLSCFFPLGKEGYTYQLVTFRTAYEIGIYNALKCLNRTSWIYKADELIILVLCLFPRPKGINILTHYFKGLEEKGYIHDLRVCIPRKWIHNF